jgi:ferrous iron transport protein A
MANTQILQLGRLKSGERATICRVGGASAPNRFVERLMEMGFVEGATVEVKHEAPIGHDPIAVEVRGTLIALRRNEANAIEVRIDQ